MKEEYLSDNAVLKQMGKRISQYRLNQNMTQSELAKEAGVSLPTIQRIEKGASSQASNLVRILRALGLIENFNDLIPEQTVSPMAQLKMQGKIRKRASSKSDTENKVSDSRWSWGE